MNYVVLHLSNLTDIHNCYLQLYYLRLCAIRFNNPAISVCDRVLIFNTQIVSHFTWWQVYSKQLPGCESNDNRTMKLSEMPWEVYNNFRNQNCIIFLHTNTVHFDAVVGPVWSYDPESYAGGSICYWYSFPCQTGHGWWPRLKGIPCPSRLGVGHGANNITP